MGGHLSGRTWTRLRAEIDGQDPGGGAGLGGRLGSASPSSPGYLNNANLLHWLGVTRSAATAEFTVRTARGSPRTIRLTAAGGRVPRMAYAPSPLYLHYAAEPCWH